MTIWWSGGHGGGDHGKEHEDNGEYADQRDQDYMTVLCVVNVLVFNFVELGCDIYQNFDHQFAKGILCYLPSKICRITGTLKSDI